MVALPGAPDKQLAQNPFQIQVHINHSLSILANPKSHSFITPFSVIRMFSGFTSLWIHCIHK